MRMRKIVDNRTLKSAAAEFLAFKRAQKIRERTLPDYQKYINPFIEQSSNSMDIDVLKRELQHPCDACGTGRHIQRQLH